MSVLNDTGWTVAASGCWEWKGSRQSKGYGSVAVDGRRILAHRLAYATWVGPIPGGQVVRYACDNPPCINPAHLLLGTHAQNSRDMVDRGRSTFGARNPAARLTAEQVVEIRARYATGRYRQRDLADQFGVSRSHISGILSGRFWTPKATSERPEVNPDMTSVRCAGLTVPKATAPAGA